MMMQNKDQWEDQQSLWCHQRCTTRWQFGPISLHRPRVYTNRIRKLWCHTN